MTEILCGTHAPITGFEVRDGELCVGGEPLSHWTGKLGQTPYYLYDSALIRQRVEQLRSAIPQVHIHYAVKANPLKQLVSFIAPLVDGLDVASAGELGLVMNCNVAADRVSFAGPGKRDSELELALRAGITVNIESPRELDVLQRLGASQDLRPRVAIRVNPPFQLRASGMRMGGGAQQFGIDSEQVPALLRQIDPDAVDFVGFHIFTGSQNLDTAAICEGQRSTCELAIELSRHAPGPVRKLNIGGGFGIPYFPNDKPIDLQAISNNLAALLPGVETAMPGVQVVLELGRYLVGEAGVYICRVIDRKVSRGKTFLVTDGGLHHHLAASGNFGQILRKNYPVVVANRMGSAKTEKASVVGPLCTPLDLLANDMDLAVAEPGDLVAIFHSGAYGASASPQAFLGHPPVAELLV
ncbi:MAG: pyridoxal-dependent decarboxylase, exosortase A system-associated [Gammaproteobacteria bacterium]|nr:pyridoxal-dependent decarboxylase, exosortase A system-associated [Gammaproteobacteria bacterium]